MGVTIVVGGQYGGEGKGKVVSFLSICDSAAIVARSGGPNSGHTVYYNNKKYGLRMVPSGVVCNTTRLLLGAGAFINPEVLLHEINKLKISDRIGVDFQAGILERSHRQSELNSEHLRDEIGSTCSGTGAAGSDRALRTLKLAKDIESLKPFLTDVALEINEAADAGLDIIMEGTQGFGLSLYHGSYPYVTSYDTSASSVAASLGLGPKKVDEIIVVVRTFPIRVAPGPLKSELSINEIEQLGIIEHGTVTGRPRRVGRFDMELVKRAVMINFATQIALTGVDYLNNKAHGIRKYEKLPRNVKTFVSKIENETKTPVTLISTGPETESMIDLRYQYLRLRGKSHEQAHTTPSKLQPLAQT